MANLSGSEPVNQTKKRFYSKRWFKITFAFLILFLIAGGIVAWKTGNVLNKITEGGLIGSLVHSIPGIEDNIKNENGQTNVLLLGMRGENIPGGGLLADTIMLVSLEPEAKRVAIISIPRDLYVTVPGSSSQSKINGVHAYGEEKGRGQGLSDMKSAVSEITGLPVHYSVSINFEGFKQLIDAVGGLEITLDQPFEEPLQFNEAKVCDGDKGGVFTERTGQYEYKKNEKGKIVAAYPLCTNPYKECGGDFKLPAGKQILDGNKALCYVRSRVTSNDFERAKRQQMILQLLKNKLLSAGTLTDMGKVNDILNALGDNVRSDMEAWEMAKFFDLYQASNEYQTYQRVLENSEEGLLYSPPETNGAGYILLPRGDNYDRIHETIRNIFTLPPQSDIKPK